MMPLADAARSRFDPAATAGHYESWFVRANHPERALAFWIRYTLFSPRGRPQDAVGEVWAIFFDGERSRVNAAKDVFPIQACEIGAAVFAVAIGSSTLATAALRGEAGGDGARLSWSLASSAGGPPLMLLPSAFYARRMPRAKALVMAPNALFDGRLGIGGAHLAVDGWQGSQNHNWGSRHTDSYAWGQVAGFDGAPGVFLECTTARLKLGPWWTPALTLVVLRVDGEEYALNSLSQAVRSNAKLDFFDWEIDAAARGVRIALRIHAPREAFAGLAYPNPPGGVKTCLNSKLAACELVLERDGCAPLSFSTRHRAAFEILTERSDHGVAMLA